MRRRRGGFTLVEVLVALAIVTVGLAALFNVTSQSVRTPVMSTSNALDMALRPATARL